MGYQDELNNWIEQERLAIQAIVHIHRLWTERSVELLMFRRPLVNKSPVDILKAHHYARQISQVEMSIIDSLPIIENLPRLDLCPSRIDIGRLTMEWLEAGLDRTQIRTFLQEKLAALLEMKNRLFEPVDVVLYGFGRIGRLMARILVEQEGRGDALKLRAVVCRGKLDLHKRAELLLRDSVHGPLHGNLTVLESENALLANGVKIQFISANSPDQIDYTQYGIDNALVIDNTGVWRDRAGLGKHLEAKGVRNVLLTAPGKGDIPNIVYGVNTRDWKDGERIFSAASCTTNAIVPPLKVLNDMFGIDYAHIETVHSYTNDQNLLDNYHEKERRGRGAPLNMVITETGAASAIAKALPELTGRVTGNAVRVPTPNVSLAILNMTLSKEVGRDEINEALRQASLRGPLVAQIDYTRNEPVVSSDMVGNNHACIIDSLATITHGRQAVVYAWYDNEYGYSTQVARVARIISGVERVRYY